MTQPQGGIQRDEQGRPYILQGTRRIYISPTAFGGTAPKDTTGIFRSRPQWNQRTGKFETPIDWGNVLSVLAASGIGAGALSAAGVFGGGTAGTAGAAGAAGGGGVLPSSSLPALSLMGGPAAIASQGVSSGIPFAAGAIGSATTLAGRHLPVENLMGGPPNITSQNVSSNRLGWRDRLKNVGKRTLNGGGGGGFNPWQQAALAALAGLPALLANKGPSNEEKALYDQVRQMTELQRRRLEHQNPLFSAVTQLAMSRLPTASQQPLQDF